MRRRGVRILLLLLVAAPLAAAALMLERAPSVGQHPAAGPESAASTRDLVRRIRHATEGERPDRTVRASLAELDDAMRFAARALPGVRARASISGDALRLQGSVPVPFVPALGWLNIEVAVPSFEGAPQLAALRVGAIDLPAGLSLALGTRLANLVLGGGAGDRILASVSRLEVEPDGVVATVALDKASRGALARRIFGLIRGDALPRAEEIRAHVRAFRAAMEAGRLPTSGSLLPYLQFAVERAQQAPPERRQTTFTAALFALTKVCGGRGYRLILGRLAAAEQVEPDGRWTASCADLRLGGRVDSTRHFVVSAAIQAASTVSISFTVGEYKELVDTLRAGGFDFADIAANASGIRFAATFLGAPPAAWADLLAAIQTEGDLMAPLDGLPGPMSQQAFEARFSNIQSPTYRAMVERIERSVDRLRLHRGRARPAR